MASEAKHLQTMKLPFLNSDLCKKAQSGLLEDESSCAREQKCPT